MRKKPAMWSLRDAAADEAGGKQMPRKAGQEQGSHEPETSWARSGGGSASGGASVGVYVHSRSLLGAARPCGVHEVCMRCA